MGDYNQLDFARRHLALFEPPVLEVGSRDYGNTQDLRPLLGTDDYIGVDLEPGPGVDKVLDMTADFVSLERELGGRRFRTIFCLSVLEHCTDPFAMCDNISRLTADGGHVLISVPHVWEVHDYPSDYWRFTADAVKLLFPPSTSRGSGRRRRTETSAPACPCPTSPRWCGTSSPTGGPSGALAEPCAPSWRSGCWVPASCSPPAC